jgi:hypothetical protein
MRSDNVSDAADHRRERRLLGHGPHVHRDDLVLRAGRVDVRGLPDQEEAEAGRAAREARPARQT